MHRDAHTQAHKDTHQHLERSLVIKNTPTHSTHSLRTPNRYTYIHTGKSHRQERIHRDKFQTVTKNTRAPTDSQHTYKPSYRGSGSRRQDPRMQGRDQRRGKHPTLSKAVGSGLRGGLMEDGGMQQF